MCVDVKSDGSDETHSTWRLPDPPTQNRLPPLPLMLLTDAALSLSEQLVGGWRMPGFFSSIRS